MWFKSGKTIIFNGREYKIRHETKEEQKEFEKNWRGFEQALQKHTECAARELEKNEQKEVKNSLDRVKIDGKSNISSTRFTEAIENNKNDLRRIILSNLIVKSINDKHNKEDKIEKEEIEKEELKKMDKLKALNKEIIKDEIIKDENSLGSRQTFDYIFQNFKVIADKPHIYLKVNHELVRLPIKTGNKKFCQ